MVKTYKKPFKKRIEEYYTKIIKFFFGLIGGKKMDHEKRMDFILLVLIGLVLVIAPILYACLYLPDLIKNWQDRDLVLNVIKRCVLCFSVSFFAFLGLIFFFFFKFEEAFIFFINTNLTFLVCIFHFFIMKSGLFGGSPAAFSVLLSCVTMTVSKKRWQMILWTLVFLLLFFCCFIYDFFTLDLASVFSSTKFSSKMNVVNLYSVMIGDFLIFLVTLIFFMYKFENSTKVIKRIGSVILNLDFENSYLRNFMSKDSYFLSYNERIFQSISRNLRLYSSFLPENLKNNNNINNNNNNNNNNNRSNSNNSNNSSTRDDVNKKFKMLFNKYHSLSQKNLLNKINQNSNQNANLNNVTTVSIKSNNSSNNEKLEKKESNKSASSSSSSLGNNKNSKKSNSLKSNQNNNSDSDSDSDSDSYDENENDSNSNDKNDNSFNNSQIGFERKLEYGMKYCNDECVIASIKMPDEVYNNLILSKSSKNISYVMTVLLSEVSKFCQLAGGQIISCVPQMIECSFNIQKRCMDSSKRAAEQFLNLKSSQKVFLKKSQNNNIINVINNINSINNNENISNSLNDSASLSPSSPSRSINNTNNNTINNTITNTITNKTSFIFPNVASLNLSICIRKYNKACCCFGNVKTIMKNSGSNNNSISRFFVIVPDPQITTKFLQISQRVDKIVVDSLVLSEISYDFDCKQVDLLENNESEQNKYFEVFSIEKEKINPQNNNNPQNTNSNPNSNGSSPLRASENKFEWFDHNLVKDQLTQSDSQSHKDSYSNAWKSFQQKNYTDSLSHIQSYLIHFPTDKDAIYLSNILKNFTSSLDEKK